MHLSQFVSYRLDLLVLAVLAAAGIGFAAWTIKRYRRATIRLPAIVPIAVTVMVLAGGGLAEMAGAKQRDFLQRTFAGFGPTYAAELKKMGHAKIGFATPAGDPTYLAIVAAEKEWLRLNPLIADVYTFRRDSDGRIRFVVDSETDYNHNGIIDGEREQRTPIGEPYPEATPAFFRALDGQPGFEPKFVSDRWGVWVSAVAPIYDERGNVEAAVGIDYPADAWVAAIAIRRALVLTTMAFLIGLLITTATLLTVMRSEIAERAAAQRELQKAKEAADAASRAKGEFLAVMSHEIRTPLTAVTGYASMLEETPLDAIQQRYLRTMRRGATALVDLLNNILDFSRIEEGKLQLEEAPCAPAEIIREVLDLLLASASEKNLVLTFDDRLGGPLLILSDHARLRQILINLVGNAVKFTAKGAVTVAATWTTVSHEPNIGTLEIRVSDTGPGIPPEKLPHLFQMFSQADAGTARRHGGSGLGLAISRRLVEMMGGKIGVQSVPGAGSEFTFSFSAKRIPIEAYDSDRESALDAPTPVGNAAPAEGRLLVVDDNPVNCEVLKALLSRAGYDIDIATSGKEAVVAAMQNRYTAILMDVAMPEMDGMEATRKIRASEVGIRTPIIAVTAATSKADREGCTAAGMDAFVTKPVDASILLSAVARAIAPGATPETTPPAGSTDRAPRP